VVVSSEDVVFLKLSRCNPKGKLPPENGYNPMTREDPRYPLVDRKTSMEKRYEHCIAKRVFFGVTKDEDNENPCSKKVLNRS